MRKSFILLTISLFFISASAINKVEKWRIYEIVLKGTTKTNPFTDVQLSAKFSNGKNVKTVSGFYDGNGIYKIRFMPQETGTWSYITSSNLKSLQNKKDTFEC